MLMGTGPASERRATDMNIIRTKLRFLARLVNAMRARAPESTLFDLLCPRNYDTLVETVRGLAEQSPQMALALSHHIKRCISIKIAMCIVRDAHDTLRSTENLQKLYDASWSKSVSSSTLRKQKLRQLNKADALPLITDIRKLTDYLDQEMKKRVENTVGENQCMLIKLVLTKLILFNKRGPAEVAQLKVEDFRRAASADDNEDIFMGLSTSEKAIAKR